MPARSNPGHRPRRAPIYATLFAVQEIVITTTDDPRAALDLSIRMPHCSIELRLIPNRGEIVITTPTTDKLLTPDTEPS